MNGALVGDLARQYGTPVYIYSLDDVRVAAAELLRALPRPSRLYYSVKANPHPLIVRELVRCGLVAEISSSGELEVVRNAGLASGHCLYTGPGKTSGEIEAAVRAGVRTFSVESETDYRRVGATARSLRARIDILVRLNLPVQRGRAGLRMSGKSTQFGLSADKSLPGSPFFTDEFARIIGLHMFSASNIMDERSLAEELTESIGQAASYACRAGLEPKVVDIGGGFGAPYARSGARPRYRDLRKVLEEALNVSLPGWRKSKPLPAFESGRFLTAGCGILASRVLDVKTTHGTTYVVLDAGTNVLSGMSGSGRLLPPSVDCIPLTPAGGTRDVHPVTIVGPLCTPLDVLSRGRLQYVPRPDELVAIPNVGAYGASAALLAFLSREMPAEVVLDGEMVVAATRRELRSLPISPGSQDANAQGT